MREVNSMNLQEQEADDEISLIDLLAVLLAHKRLIVGVTAVSALFSAVISIVSLKLPPEKSFMPNQFTVQSHMLVNDSENSSSLSSLLGSSAAGLASLAGISAAKGSSNSALASYILQSNGLLDAVADKFKLIEKWNIEKHPRSSCRDMLKKMLVSDFDDETGVFTVKFTDIDPAFARDVVNFSVDYLESVFLSLGIDKNLLKKENLESNINAAFREITALQQQIKNVEHSVSDVYSVAQLGEVSLKASLLKLELEAQEEIYKQLKAQYEMVKIEIANDSPVFQILERAEIPDRKSKPSRGKLCIIVTFAGFFISVFAAFFLNAVENIRSDDEAMKKLSGRKCKGDAK